MNNKNKKLFDTLLKPYLFIGISVIVFASRDALSPDMNKQSKPSHNQDKQLWGSYPTLAM